MNEKIGKNNLTERIDNYEAESNTSSIKNGIENFLKLNILS